MLYLKFISRLL